MKKPNGSSKGLPFRRPMVLLICFALVGLPVILWTRSALTGPSYAHSDPLGFIPTSSVSKKQQKMKCEELFRGTAAKDFTSTDLYEKSLSHYVAASSSARQGNIRSITYDVPNETPQLYRTLQYIAVESKATTGCIAGFNLGQGAFSLLTANSRIVVHAFRRATAVDHSQRMEKLLNEKFNNRLIVHDGDTVETIPKFISNNIKRLRCDIILITGPLDYHNTKADLTNLAHIANLTRNHIVFADHLSVLVKKSGGVVETESSSKAEGRKTPVDAWEEGCSSGMLVEKMHCAFTPTHRMASNNPYRGFAVGVVSRGPDFRDGLARQARNTTRQVKGNRYRKRKYRTRGNKTSDINFSLLSPKPTVLFAKSLKQ